MLHARTVVSSVCAVAIALSATTSPVSAKKRRQPAPDAYSTAIAVYIHPIVERGALLALRGFSLGADTTDACRVALATYGHHLKVQAAMARLVGSKDVPRRARTALQQELNLARLSLGMMAIQLDSDNCRLDS